MVLGDTCLAAREISLDILHINVRAGRNRNKYGMVPTRQGVLMVAAAAAVAAADGSAAAVVARGAVKPTAADATEEAAKPNAADYDDADDLCRRACREHCHDLHGPVEPRRRAPGLCLAALHLWPGHGCRRHVRPSSSNPRSVPGLPSVHRAHCLSSSKSFFLNIENRGKVIQDSTVNSFFSRTDAVPFEFHHQGFCSGDIVPDGLFPILNVSSSNTFVTLS